MNVNRVLNGMVTAVRLLALRSVLSEKRGPSGDLLPGHSAAAAPPGTARAALSKAWKESKSFFTRHFDVAANRLVRLVTGQGATPARTHFGTQAPTEIEQAPASRYPRRKSGNPGRWNRAPCPVRRYRLEAPAAAMCAAPPEESPVSTWAASSSNRGG